MPPITPRRQRHARRFRPAGRLAKGRGVVREHDGGALDAARRARRGRAPSRLFKGRRRQAPRHRRRAGGRGHRFDGAAARRRLRVADAAPRVCGERARGRVGPRREIHRRPPFRHVRLGPRHVLVAQHGRAQSRHGRLGLWQGGEGPGGRICVQMRTRPLLQKSSKAGHPLRLRARKRRRHGHGVWAFISVGGPRVRRRAQGARFRNHGHRARGQAAHSQGHGRRRRRRRAQFSGSGDSFDGRESATVDAFFISHPHFRRGHPRRAQLRRAFALLGRLEEQDSGGDGRGRAL
mmetsp:Transcript_19725/g.67718  ORF Transcript_19725/g.67718 Transcript_19725/m.67718 type:complete len:292 (+) Transcript_19725:1083-1958(+)